MKDDGNSGFALTTAIIFMSIVSIVVTGLAIGIAENVRRTAAQRQGVQLRQLLLAGAQIARRRAERGQFDHAPVSLPAALSNASIDIALAKDGVAIKSQIRVTCESASAGENVNFELRGDRCEVVDIRGE